MTLADQASWSQAKRDAYRKAFDEIEQARQLAREAEARGEAKGKEAGLREGEAKGEARGKEAGLLEGLRATVADLCELLGVELNPARRAHLVALDLAGLSALRSHLKAHKTWPT